ncbi:hypothetical protein [Protaetiibacter intestinalis]|uniref:AbiEi antitoxin C-terminal domain-containing protein n=1 Tax=Protaetiibacter intestinalis TaxID=2419774 RepID=A0A387B5X4_9MICO|nr:hypothetical protein [Protaetiibacter intestinalis]AYF99124.1 hypothetical protein D7I47_13225 [Protaetiibacter intestinalis]
MEPFPVVEFPDPVRQAMRLDGELFRLGDAFVPVGMPECPELRAAAAIAGRSRRLIPARATASWIWGAALLPALRPEFVVDTGARWAPVPGEGIDVVETVIRPGETVDCGGVAVTSPLRTAVDLARFRMPFTLVDAEQVRTLAALGGFGLAEALASLEEARHLAGKLLAVERLTATLADQPELTR